MYMDIPSKSESMKSIKYLVTEHRASAQRAAFGVALIGLLVLGACGGNEPAPTATPPAIAVESGGMALTAAVTPAATASGSPAAHDSSAATQATTASAEATTAAASPTAVLEPGAKVTAAGKLRLYADPDASAQRLAQYPADAVFVVVEPTGEFKAYPVENGGARWYRLRAADGLVGWAMANGLASQ